MTAAAFPTLARVARAARATRGATTVARATWTALSALGAGRLAPDRSPAERARALSLAAADLCAQHRLEVDVVGVPPARPCVIVANHVSYLDPLVILSYLPAMPIAKAEVAGWPLIGPAADALGVLFVDRERPLARARVLRAGLRVLRAGTSVLNFAEGTTTDGTRLLPFHRGSFGLAMLARVPVVPVALRFDDPRLAWTGRATFLPHYWRMSSAAGGRVRMTVRAPMWPRPGEPAAHFAARVRTVIAHTAALPEAA